MEKKKVIGFYDYTVVLTYVGMICAFVGIISVFKGMYLNAVMFLMGAGFCDMFDGAVASTKDRNSYEKHFGIQIDSMCDLISFGLLPALFVYRISGETLTVTFIACGYLLCGIIRLAYYNVQEFERQQQTEEKREFFLGVPITTSAILLPFAFIIFEEFGLKASVLFPIVITVLGFGFVAGVEIKKPQKIGKIAMMIFGLAEFVFLIILAGA